MIYQKTLLALLTAPIALQPTEVPPILLKLSDEDLARIYVDVEFLRTCLDFLVEQLWLACKNNSSITITKFIEPFLVEELAPLKFLHSYISISLERNPKQLQEAVAEIQTMVLQTVKMRSASAQKIFSVYALRLISAIFEFENEMSVDRREAGQAMPLSLYRTFDSLDAIFELDYGADDGMKTDLSSSQRLYEGAGAGVQSGYSTMLLALQHLAPAHGARMVDLGSGYGRLGFVVGLVRPDIYFTGYEFVPHRIEASKKIANHLGLSERVQFYAQDLVAEGFQIPAAEIYYMYDPFGKAAYDRVLARLVEVSQQMPIAIVTKGNARGWVLEIAEREKWPAPVEFDSGNLCLFRSI